jgi:transmembrane sensor
MDKKELIEPIIYKFLNGSATVEESGELTEWLNQDRENRRHYFAIKRIWIENRDIPDEEKLKEDSLNRLKLRTTLQILKENRSADLPRLNIRKMSIAATILILLGVSSFLAIKLKSLSDFDQTLNEISAPLGARTNIVLPDGTSVWLNAGSNLSYRSDFGRMNRDVSLTGEAYFDVNPDKGSVFTVITSDMNIRALGTQFNVKSYPEEDVTETTLVSGRIEVSVTDEVIRTQPVILSSNQRITYSRDTRNILVREEEKNPEEEEIIVAAESELVAKPSLMVLDVIDTEEYTSWKDGRLTFRGESLATLAPKLERFYNLKISFDDESLKDLKYTGVLETVTIEEVMRAISSASGINFKIDKNKIVFTN